MNQKPGLGVKLRTRPVAKVSSRNPYGIVSKPVQVLWRYRALFFPAGKLLGREHAGHVVAELGQAPRGGASGVGGAAGGAGRLSHAPLPDPSYGFRAIRKPLSFKLVGIHPGNPGLEQVETPQLPQAGDEGHGDRVRYLQQGSLAWARPRLARIRSCRMVITVCSIE